MKTVRKVFFVYDFDKEEQWLNEMAMQGWKLKSVGFMKYTFEPCVPGEYIIRMEMKQPDEGYLELLNDMGAEHICHFTSWNFYARKTELGRFELNGDIDSKIEHMNRINKMLKCLCFANICIGIGNTHTGFGWINLLVATLLAYGWGRIQGKIDALENEREIHE